MGMFDEEAAEDLFSDPIECATCGAEFTTGGGTNEGNAPLCERCYVEHLGQARLFTL